VIPVGAGDVSLTDHGTTLATLMAATSGYSAYSSVGNPPTSTLVWQPGDALHVGSTGGAVHSFAGSATAGTPLSVLSPALAGTLSVSLSADLTVSWTPDPLRSDETVTVNVYAGTSTNQVDGQVACLASDASGRATVPAAMLGQLHAGDHGQLVVSRFSLSAITGDNANIDLRQGSSAVASATFQ
jgi:hypothetical protein